MLKKLLILGIIAILAPTSFAAGTKEDTNMSELYQITENFIILHVFYDRAYDIKFVRGYK